MRIARSRLFRDPAPEGLPLGGRWRCLAEAREPGRPRRLAKSSTPVPCPRRSYSRFQSLDFVALPPHTLARAVSSLWRAHFKGPPVADFRDSSRPSLESFSGIRERGERPGAAEASTCRTRPRCPPAPGGRLHGHLAEGPRAVGGAVHHGEAALRRAAAAFRRSEVSGSRSVCPEQVLRFKGWNACVHGGISQKSRLRDSQLVES